MRVGPWRRNELKTQGARLTRKARTHRDVPSRPSERPRRRSAPERGIRWNQGCASRSPDALVVSSGNGCAGSDGGPAGAGAGGGLSSGSGAGGAGAAGCAASGAFFCATPLRRVRTLTFRGLRFGAAWARFRAALPRRARFPFLADFRRGKFLPPRADVRSRDKRSHRGLNLPTVPAVRNPRIPEEAAATSGPLVCRGPGDERL